MNPVSKESQLFGWEPGAKPKKPIKKMTAKAFNKLKPKKETVGGLVKSLDTWFSRRVRLEECDENYMATCIDCGKPVNVKRADLGHYHSRRHYSLRWERKNVAVQAKRCNMLMNDPAINEGFKRGLVKRHGPLGFDMLAFQKENLFKLDRNLLKHLIEDEKKQVAELLKNKRLEKWW